MAIAETCVFPEEGLALLMQDTGGHAVFARFLQRGMALSNACVTFSGTPESAREMENAARAYRLAHNDVMAAIASLQGGPVRRTPNRRRVQRASDRTKR
jgi:hypothetical protein